MEGNTDYHEELNEDGTVTCVDPEGFEYLLSKTWTFDNSFVFESDELKRTL